MYQAIRSFSCFTQFVGEPLCDNLKEMGVHAPNQIQTDALLPALSCRDVLVTAQTGAGKTLVLLLPIVELLHRLSQQVGGSEGIQGGGAVPGAGQAAQGGSGAARGGRLEDENGSVDHHSRGRPAAERRAQAAENSGVGRGGCSAVWRAL